MQNVPFFLICHHLSQDRGMCFCFSNNCQAFIYDLNESWKGEDRHMKKPENISFYSANQHILHNYKVVINAASSYTDLYLPSTL